MPITRRSALFGVVLLATPATAQDTTWPARTVRIVVPFPPGGSTDILARILAEQLQQRLGASFVVENRPGAGGSIGADVVAKAEGDGYTLLMATIGTAAINYGLYGSKLPYKPADLVAVSKMANVPNVIVVPASSPSRTLPELVTRAKGTAGGLTYASSGNGTSLHLTGELLKEASGIELEHVPLYVAACLVGNDISPSSKESGEPHASLRSTNLCGRYGPAFPNSAIQAGRYPGTRPAADPVYKVARRGALPCSPAMMVAK